MKKIWKRAAALAMAVLTAGSVRDAGRGTVLPPESTQTTRLLHR